jgi:hypothetical protein
MRLNRWAKSGVPERIFWALQAEGLLGLEVLSLDSTAVKVHPDAHGASKKRETGDREESGRLEYEDKRVGGGGPSRCGVQFIARERG